MIVGGKIANRQNYCAAAGRAAKNRKKIASETERGITPPVSPRRGRSS
jgi:hypothetical protein